MTRHRWPIAGFIGRGMLGSLLLVPNVALADWTVKRLTNAQGALERCVVEATPFTMSDGYQSTEVVVSVSRDSVQVKTKAPLDENFRDLSLQVDKHPPVALELLVGDRVALVTTQYASLVEQMKRGSTPPPKGQKPPSPTLKLQLRFWPTWPARGLQTADLSLEGFRKAYTELGTCK